MFAVIKTGGKQYRVEANDVLIVEKRDGEAGEKISFDDVLMMGEGDNVTVGEPVIEGASVQAEVLEQRKGDKVIVFKKKRRQNYRRKRGHRQEEMVVRITDILAKGAKAKKTAAKKPAKKAAAEADKSE